MKAINLRTEHMTDPLGIDVREPYLSWNCSGGVTQTAYQIEASSDGNIVWNSGKVETNKMSALFGAATKSRQRVTWKVRLWDENDDAGDWSREAFFEMGLLDSHQFVAAWINPELTCDPAVHQPASYLRTSFSVDPCAEEEAELHTEADTTAEPEAGRENSSGKQARLYITCHGLYEAYINGQRVGNFVLAPGTDTYDKLLAYQTYDVTDLVKSGKNEVQVILGDGWYRSCSGVDGERNVYGEDVALFFQLENDGKPVCVSDESWEAAQDGPIRENDMQQGEVYDARMETPKNWHGVKVEAFGADCLACSNSVPIVEQERFAGTILTTPNGETVIDYGQNLAGYVEFTVRAHEGDVIVMTHGETLDENGNFTAENFQDRERHQEGGTAQRVTYICKEGVNHYKSRFTIWGFRYAKVETQIDLTDAAFTSIAVYSRMEQTGWFTCSNKDVEKLVQNSLWSQKSNFCDVPTDCPTRERAAWTGDMGVFVDTGIFLEDCYPVIRKWLGECRLNQYADGKVANIAPKNKEPSFTTKMLAGSVGWGDACILVPYALYKRYDDVRILEENYEMMQRWYAYLESRAGESPQPDLSQLPEKYRAMAANLPKEYLEQMKKKMTEGMDSGKQNPYAAYTIESGVDYGEWCEPGVSATDVMRKPQSKVATAYYAKSGRLLAEISEILGKPEEAAHYRETAQNAAKAFHWIATENGEIHSDRQAEYVRAISFDLLSEEEKRTAAATLNEMVVQNDYHLNTGFLSTPALCSVLTEYGYTETAYRLLLQDTMPGWLYEVKKGATTVWENWDGINEKGEVKASLNHYSYGAVCGWLFQGVCGIRLENGTLTIAPHPYPLLEYAKAVYQSPVGEIVSGWKYENGKPVYEFSIPSNVRARIILPDGREKNVGTGIWRLE